MALLALCGVAFFGDVVGACHSIRVRALDGALARAVSTFGDHLCNMLFRQVMSIFIQKLWTDSRGKVVVVWVKLDPYLIQAHHFHTMVYLFRRGTTPASLHWHCNINASERTHDQTRETITDCAPTHSRQHKQIGLGENGVATVMVLVNVALGVALCSHNMGDASLPSQTSDAVYWSVITVSDFLTSRTLYVTWRIGLLLTSL